MYARFNLQIGSKSRMWSYKNANRYGLLILIGVTAVFLFWLIYHVIFQPTWLKNLPTMLVEFVSLSETAGTFTLGFIWAALWWRWRRKKRVPTVFLPTLTVAEMYALSPGGFEKYVGQVFSKKGYYTKLRGGSGDHGVDVELTQKNGKRAIVQCKRYRHTVGSDIVRELYGTLIHERAAHAFLVTTAEISDAAREWAQYKPLTLIDGETMAAIANALSQR